ncbi:hypothetical protein FACS18942_04090 [Planctomycetales bacterium]|nr:hypothetical protein FACS18942_04090 [Planctomycetales bacterium]GHT34650.1 hypothetical protein FACS189427_02340 [Planctomycetales bacterium]
MSSVDPGDDTIKSWTINWGDGKTTVVGGNPSSVSHAYDKTGNYTVSATATDEDGTWHANTLNIQVASHESGIIKGTPWLSGDPEMYEGRTYTLDLHANYANIERWLINWGDGSATETVAGTANKATHVYLLRLLR